MKEEREVKNLFKQKKLKEIEEELDEQMEEIEIANEDEN